MCARKTIRRGDGSLGKPAEGQDVPALWQDYLAAVGNLGRQDKYRYVFTATDGSAIIEGGKCRLDLVPVCENGIPYQGGMVRMGEKKVKMKEQDSSDLDMKAFEKEFKELLEEERHIWRSWEKGKEQHLKRVGAGRIK